MKRHDALTKGLAITGAVFAWFPILATLFFAGARTIQGAHVRLDYLMPAELFPAVLIGGVLLVWAAFRARDRRALIGWSAGLTLAAFLSTILFAMASGLASGAREATGGWIAAASALVGLYDLGLIVLAVSGIVLIVDLFRGDRQQIAPTVPAA